MRKMQNLIDSGGVAKLFIVTGALVGAPKKYQELEKSVRATFTMQPGLEDALNALFTSFKAQQSSSDQENLWRTAMELAKSKKYNCRLVSEALLRAMDQIRTPNKCFQFQK